MSGDASEFSDLSDADAPTPQIHVRARPGATGAASLAGLVSDVSSALAEMQVQSTFPSSLLDLVDFSTEGDPRAAPPPLPSTSLPDTTTALPLSLPSDDAAHAAHSPVLHNNNAERDADLSALLPAAIARDARDALAIVAGEYARCAESGATITLGGPSIALDHLGPIVIGTDGSTSRITNWAEMDEPERARTASVIAKRNEKRRVALGALPSAVSTDGGSL